MICSPTELIVKMSSRSSSGSNFDPIMRFRFTSAAQADRWWKKTEKRVKTDKELISVFIITYYRLFVADWNIAALMLSNFRILL